MMCREAPKVLEPSKSTVESDGSGSNFRKKDGELTENEAAKPSVEADAGFLRNRESMAASIMILIK